MSDIVGELRECHCFACRDQGRASIHQKAADEIERLRRNLETRDDFIGEIGQWKAFVDHLPK